VRTSNPTWTGYATHRPDDGGNKHPWNVGKLPPDYTAQQPRRLSSLDWTKFIAKPKLRGLHKIILLYTRSEVLTGVEMWVVVWKVVTQYRLVSTGYQRSCWRKRYFTPKREISGSHGGEYEESLLGFAPCSLVEITWRFRCTYCLHHIPEGCHLLSPKRWLPQTGLYWTQIICEPELRHSKGEGDGKGKGRQDALCAM
jgi:hypothetical protein